MEGTISFLQKLRLNVQKRINKEQGAVFFPTESHEKGADMTGSGG